MRRLSKICKQLQPLALIVCAVFVLVQIGQVYALTSEDLYSINSNTAYYDPNDNAACNTAGGGGSGGVLLGSNNQPGIWKSGLTGPYSLEDFAVEVLKDIATKLNVSQTSTVTPEHVLALVAFAFGEGGNLTNSDIYNPWNTNYTSSDLQPVNVTGGGGLQSYASFDEGVEVGARTMAGYTDTTQQTRLGSILANPTSTAADFMKTLTYYQNYPNQHSWAQASEPPNQDSYYQERLSLLNATRQHYVDRASTQLGPPGNNYTDGVHVPASQLKYVPTGSSTSVSTGSGVGVASSDCNTTAAATSSTPGVYKNPFRDIMKLQNIVPERIDGGVDYTGGDGPVYAVGNGKVVFSSASNTGWPGLGTDNSGAFISYQLSDGPATGKYIYMAEDCQPLVTAGQQVTADTPICNYHYQGTACETGWGRNGNGYVEWSDYHDGGGGSYASNSGQNFSLFLVSLGVPAGIVEGSRSTAALPTGWPTSW